MAFETAPAADSWDAALAHALRDDGVGREGASLFLEEREDLRVVGCLRGADECVHSRLAGLALDRDDPPLHRFVSDPVHEDALELVAGRAPKTGARTSAPTAPALDPVAATATVESLLDALARRLRGRGPFDAQIHWVAFRQSVRVACRTSPVRHDLREGRRIRVRAALEGRGPVILDQALEPNGSIDPEAVALAIERRTDERRRLERVRPGQTCAVFAAGVGGVLIHELVGHALEADVVDSGDSLIASLATPVAAPCVRVVDDPRQGRAPWRWDDDGHGAGEVTLVRDGRVEGLIHDRRSASRRGVQANGHGRRSSFSQRVLPRLGCTYLAPGTLHAEEVLQGIERGVFVRRLEVSSSDTQQGVATFLVTDADRIQNGSLACALAPFAIEVSALEALSTLDRVAHDLAFDTCIGSCLRDGQALSTSVGAPTFRVGLIRVAG